jgi:exodeoxyribonuclease VII small subunit
MKEVDYQALNAELSEILATLQSEDLSVDQALKGYERGIAITKELEKYLKSAENKVVKIRSTLEA